MRKAARNYLVALIVFLLALFQIISGFALWLVLPRGRGYMGGRGGGLTTGATFLWPRDTWVDLHNWVAVALLVIVALRENPATSRKMLALCRAPKTSGSYEGA